MRTVRTMTLILIDHNHSDVFGRRLCDGLPKNKTGGLFLGSLGGSSKVGSYFLGVLFFFGAVIAASARRVRAARPPRARHSQRQHRPTPR